MKAHSRLFSYLINIGGVRSLRKFIFAKALLQYCYTETILDLFVDLFNYLLYLYSQTTKSILDTVSV